MAEAKTKGNGADPTAAKALPTLRPDKCFCAEQKTQSLVVFAPAGLAAGDVGNPAIWQALSRMLQPFSTGWVIAEDERWAVEFMVRSAIPGRCTVVALRTVDLPAFDHAARRTLPQNMSVRFGGASVGWVVERKNPDGSLTVLGRGTDHPEWHGEEDVIRWCLDHASVRQPAEGVRRFPV
ncbi:MAG: hypothetical protein IT530_02265 [Burkholderiales bacterium]|nr:hypothetical protein [Burkholderiales bacterium]